ncbi:MAG: mannitol dehydrogenase family protein [Microthrixaceae bacterium]
MRLTTRSLDSIEAQVPEYDRSATPRIVHLGVGAFARAHIGVYADDLLTGGYPATIAGVSLRDPRTERELTPQDCLYTVSEREPETATGQTETGHTAAGGPQTRTRVIGAFTSMATGPDAAVDSILRAAATARTSIADASIAQASTTQAPTIQTRPSTTGDTSVDTSADTATREISALVTLTVTEKGYEVPGGDLASPHAARSAPGVIARALALCRENDLRPPVIASLDNVMNNGNVLRDAVMSVAEPLDPALPQWINENVVFPNSVVDRMVPATTDSDRDAIASAIGARDEGAVVAEHHRSWAIQMTDGLPPFDLVGAEFVRDVSDHQRRKLWLLNAPHSAVAYCGLLIGSEFIADAIEVPLVRRFTEALIADILSRLRICLPSWMLPGSLPSRWRDSPTLGSAIVASRSRPTDHESLPKGSTRSPKHASRVASLSTERRW